MRRLLDDIERGRTRRRVRTVVLVVLGVAVFVVLSLLAFVGTVLFGSLGR